VTRIRLAAPLLCGLLALTGCGDGDGEDQTAESPPPSATTSAAAVERPRVGDCHRLNLRDVLGSADPEPPVECSDKHTSETVHVGTFKATAATAPQALTEDEANRRAAQTCRTEAASYLATEPGRLWLSRVEVFWFVPTQEEVDAGADWLRCDVVVLERDDRLMALPRTVKGALGKPNAFDRYGLCGTARPGAEEFKRVTCGSQHSWRAISTISIDGGRRYPGLAAVRGAGEEACQAQARAAQDNALQYDYGWEWPTKAQWETGQRHGYCWAPAQR
jgi:hypothetical protein